MTLQSTYLLQRLNPPRRPKSTVHRVFGGHMLGLGEKAWDLLDEHCTLAYMGAAEYEFGTLPKALGEFVERSKAGQLQSFAFLIGPHERELSPHRRDRFTKKLWPAQTVCVYGFGRESDLADVQERIRFLARGGQGTYIKAGSHLAHDLDVGRYLPDQSDTAHGWIELDNLFMFFSDRAMWEGFCGLFGVALCDVPELPAAPDLSHLRKPALCEMAVNLGVFRTKREASLLSKAVLLERLTGGAL